MADITPTKFRQQFPEFTEANFPDDIIEKTIESAYRICDIGELETLYCAAHLLTLIADKTAKQDGGSGEIKREEIGERIVDYVTQAKTGREAFFTTSPYGRMLSTLEKRSPKCVMGFIVA